jgi:hypothetical protein
MAPVKGGGVGRGTFMVLKWIIVWTVFQLTDGCLAMLMVLVTNPHGHDKEVVGRLTQNGSRILISDPKL